MREQLVVAGRVAPGRVIGLYRFRVAGFHAVVLRVRRTRIDRVDGLLDPPPTARHHH